MSKKKKNKNTSTFDEIFRGIDPCKNRRHYTTCTDGIGHRYGAVGQSTLRQKLHGKI